MNFQQSDQSQHYTQRVKQFIAERIRPIEKKYYHEILSQKSDDWKNWQVAPVIEELKAQAQKEGLWNLFLSDKQHGPGLSTLEYAPVAEEMGKSFIAPEIFNCNAPDTGNMEVLHLSGSTQQKAQWLAPLLEGKIRSAFCMTEPDVASSDATNMRATAALEKNEVVINGRKWWTTGIGHPNCKFVIFMGLTDAGAHRHSQHTMVLVPLDTPGVQIERMLPVFGEYDAPYGHGEVSFTNVRVPLENIILGAGRGFEIAQGRLGPGRIHHCMRCIGASEYVLQLMIERGLSRVAFGKPILNLGGNRERIADFRIAIDQARLLILFAAWKLDTVGALAAMTEISSIKVVAPNVLQMITDEAIQMHGGAGLSYDFPLTAFFAMARVIRIADGPDAVHRGLIARFELGKYSS
ncbi:MAG: acyl-CoA dehydrogenase family protein [Chitinophagales bacterium]|nr:acyl-CoA dehydrogenase family protein [Chitinophagales bacterium]